MKRLTLADVPKSDSEGKYTLEFRKSVLQGKRDLASGKTIPHKEAKRRLGL